MNKNEKWVLNAAVLREGKKRLSCTKAKKLSQEHDISLKEIGKICNRNGIRIVACQLGCFK
jgi:hypothetical protein